MDRKMLSAQRTASPGAPRIGEYLNLGEAAQLLGLRGSRRNARRRLLDHLRAKERMLGQEIMLRLGGSDRRPYHYVTLAILREHCPEFFVKRDEIVEILRERFSEIEDQICALQREVRGDADPEKYDEDDAA